MKILLLAGEESGVLYADRIRAEVLKRLPEAEIRGYGDYGFKVEDLAVMGIGQVLRKIFYFLRVKRTMEKAIADWRPDVVCTVDYPGMNLKLAAYAKSWGLRTVHVVCPQVWAWKRGRIPKIEAALDKLCCFFPFEPALFRPGFADFVGHPLVDEFGAVDRIGGTGEKKVLAVLPGSRMGEIEKHMPVLLDVVKALGDGVRVVIPAANERVYRRLQSLVSSDASISLQRGGSREALRQADAAVVASGTATLEAALIGCPTVLVYKVGWLFAFLARRFIKGVRHIGLANIIAEKADRPCPMPELLQEDFTVENVLAQLKPLLADETANAAARKALKDTTALLHSDGGSIARIVQSFLIRSILVLTMTMLAWTDVHASIPDEVDVVIAGGTVAGVREALREKSAGRRVFVAAPRPYLGEDRAPTYLLEKTPADDPNDPLVRAMFDPATRADAAWKMPEHLLGIGLSYQLGEALDKPPTPPDADGLLPRTSPLELKKALDRALLKAKIPFLTGVSVVDVERDASGRLVAVVVNGRDGNRRIRCSRLVDATLRGKAAELAGGLRKPFPKGDYVFKRAYIHEVENFKLTWRTFTVAMADGSAESFQEADNFIRDAIPPKDYIDIAETPVLENPPDVFTALPADVTVVGPCAPKGAVERVTAPVNPSAPAELEYDVVVVGVGTSGAGAAVGASRRGAKTLAVDFMPLLGGVGSEGRICGYYDGNICGFTLESDGGREALGGVYYHAQSEWFRREIRKRGGTVWFATAGMDAIKEGNRVCGVVLRMADGTCRRVKAKVVVDATGNSDVAAQAGAATDFINDRELSLQGAGLSAHQMYTLSVNSDIGFVDDTSAESMSNFALRSRLSALTALWNTSSLVDSRERRRIVGDYTLTPVDIMLERTFTDTVCRAYSRFDTHGQTEHPLVPNVLESNDRRRFWANEPYRILLPKGLEGILVTGLGISAQRDAMPVVRMQAEMRNLGYAVGVAAAMCVEKGILPRQLPVKELQRHLVSIGQLPGSVLTAVDSFPYRTSAICSAAKSLAKSMDEMPMVFHDPERGRIEVAKAYARDGSVNQAYALALLGDDRGVGQLLANLATHWDAGWNYKGMSQYGSSLSLQDRYLLAITACKPGAGMEIVLRKARCLGAIDAYSHFRALATYFEKAGDRRAVPVLARLLKIRGIGGHAAPEGSVPEIPNYSNAASNVERSDCLRELCLARALYRLGDDADGLGRRTLEAYARDPRGAFAKHAQLVLAGSRNDKGGQAR